MMSGESCARVVRHFQMRSCNPSRGGAAHSRFESAEPRFGEIAVGGDHDRNGLPDERDLAIAEHERVAPSGSVDQRNLRGIRRVVNLLRIACESKIVTRPGASRGAETSRVRSRACACGLRTKAACNAPSRERRRGIFPGPAAARGLRSALPCNRRCAGIGAAPGPRVSAIMPRDRALDLPRRAPLQRYLRTGATAKVAGEHQPDLLFGGASTSRNSSISA